VARSLIATAPTRLDFGGGWTDVPPYPEERGGFVCNLAIERRATVRLSPALPEGISLSPLAAAACSHAGVADALVSLESDFPVGAGLGGSSAAGVAVAAALARWKGQPCTLADLAESSRFVETNGLRVAGGFQDHYAAAFGGALALTFEGKNSVRQLALSDATVHGLESQCLLVYTGESRISGETITAVLDAYNDRTSHVMQSLEKMKALALAMADSIEKGDVESLGALVGEHWTHQRSLHPRISTPRIDAIEQHAYKAGALGLKALGASGGGCVIVFAPSDRIDTVAQAIAPYGERLAWRVARTGVEIRELPLSPDAVTG
jgi:D-glycero-alpha-D-manno-heptose-7-phosphate kinase